MLDLNLDRNEALTLIAKTTFSPFTKADYESFAGVESENPYIGENGDYIIILDGNMVQFMNADGDFQSFFLIGE
jgi:hypothetical protein